MPASGADRQQKWRARQAQDGLVEVRIWVPRDRARDAAAIAAAWRAGKPGRAPNNGQLYKVQKALKAKPSLRPPDESILADGAKLEVWLALNEPSRKIGSSSKAPRKQRKQRRLLYGAKLRG